MDLASVWVWKKEGANKLGCCESLQKEEEVLFSLLLLPLLRFLPSWVLLVLTHP